MMTRRTLLRHASFAAMAVVLGPMAWRIRPAAAAVKPPVALFKNPGCECCDGYAAYLRQDGFTVTVKETDKLAGISAKAGVPAEMQGCHSAFIGGYVIDGHVPVEAINRLLTERPPLKGLVLPGMPLGSPGMAGDKAKPFEILAIDQNGKTSPYMAI